MAEHDQLSDALECAICLEILSVDNKVLPCQHTFCTQCLLAVKCSLDDKHLEFRCPECRCFVHDDIENLPCNIILKRVLENLNSPKAIHNTPHVAEEELKPVRKRIQPIAESDDTDDSDNLPVSVKKSKKGRKSKPVYISEEESEEDVKEIGQVNSEATNEPTNTQFNAVKSSGKEGSSSETSSSETSEYEATDTEASDSTTEPLSEEDCPDITERKQCTPEDQRTAADGGSGSRRSSRIKEKHSKVFRKPRKEDVFSAIPSLTEGDKSVSELVPRKLVTDFTKVNSRYNYDQDYTSGEDSDMANFLDDDFEYIDEDSFISEDSNYEPQKKTKTKHGGYQRKKKGHRKTVYKDSSSEESSNSSATEYSSEDSESTYQGTSRGASSGKKPKTKQKHRLQRLQRSQIDSSSSEGDMGSNSGNSQSDSGHNSDIGDMSKSILEKVNQRSQTMSERKCKQASKFDGLRKARERRRKNTE